MGREIQKPTKSDMARAYRRAERNFFASLGPIRWKIADAGCDFLKITLGECTESVYSGSRSLVREFTLTRVNGFIHVVISIIPTIAEILEYVADTPRLIRRTVGEIIYEAAVIIVPIKANSLRRKSHQ